MKNFAVLASGNGSNLQAIIDALSARKIEAALAVVISDKEKAFALERARNANIPAVFIDPKKFSDRESFDREVVAELKKFSVDFVVLAGFMRIISHYFLNAYPDRILNIHPSLLPDFKGAAAIKDAFQAGVKTTGVTVHFVNEELDGGAIILQEALDVTPQDTLVTLEAKIHKIEHRIYPQAIDLLARGRLTKSGSKVIIR
jgi:phosphoribosylglycinamide formyltransferase 1